MPEEALDFWPDISASKLRTPLSIMKQQAALLGKHTNNLVEAEVVTRSEAGRLYHRLFLVAPTLDYRYQLLSASHDVKLYPVETHVGTGPLLLSRVISDEPEFVAWLKEILSSDETKRIIDALLAQAEA